MLPTWLTITLSLGGSALIGCVIQFIWKRTIEKKTQAKDKQKEEELAKKEKERKEYEELKEERDKQNLIKSFGLAIKPLEDKIDKISEKLDANTTGTITLLRDRMKCSLNYCQKQGFASATDKANWNELYNSYKNLGGNHFREYVNQWKAEMDDLPMSKEEEK